MAFYNDERKHPSLGYRTPGDIFAAAPAGGYRHNALALHASPQGQQQPEARNLIYARKVIASDLTLPGCIASETYPARSYRNSARFLSSLGGPPHLV